MLSEILRRLPGPMLSSLRSVRDQIAVRTFEPMIAEHVYGGIELRVRIDDKISARWYDRDFDELPEITFLKQRQLQKGALVFDLGAHHGVIALLLARIVGDCGRVIAIEAGQHNFDVATENKNLNAVENLSIVRAAVAEKGGVAISFSGGINGSISSSGESVDAKSIDELASEYGNPDVVMLDIEGYELRALQGAKATLDSNVDWYVEVHAGCGLESFGGSSAEVVQVFRDHGYNLYCQTDEHYRDQFRPMTTLPKGRFFMIAVKE
jgi:FkbM family methyltransferase